jgi:hypothetical protein
VGHRRTTLIQNAKCKMQTLQPEQTLSHEPNAPACGLWVR